MKGRRLAGLGRFVIPCGLVLLAACRPFPPVRPGIRPVVHSAQDLRARLLVRAQAIQSFKAKGRVTYISPEQKYSGKALLVGHKPRTLRVDVLSFWGQSALSFFTNGQEMQILDYRQGKLYRGPVTPGNLADFIPPVKVAELLEVLSGGVLLYRTGKAQMTYDPGPDRYRLELRSEDQNGHTVIWVDARNLEILTAQWSDAQGQRSFKVEFADFDYRSRYPLPHRITLISGDNRRRLRVHYQELLLNPPLTSEALDLVAPAAVLEVPLGP